eukprot:m51a1_g3832 hypothetical protein (202) ;mRNA; r:326814-328702
MAPLPFSSCAAPAASDDASWAISASERVAYDNLFYQTTEKTSGFLEGENARLFFAQSALPFDVLGAIWALADMDKDGKLDREEFGIAMHLSRKAKKGIPMPPVLPRALVPATKSLHYTEAATSEGEWTQFEQRAEQLVPGSQPGRDPNAAWQAPSNLSFGGGEQKSQKDGSQLARYALPSATFEQRIAFSSDLDEALKKRK